MSKYWVKKMTSGLKVAAGHIIETVIKWKDISISLIIKTTGLKSGMELHN